MLVILFVGLSLACSSNSDCSNNLFCEKGTCVECLTDAQCRNNNQCNSVCEDFICKPVLPVLTCNETNVCYEMKGECLPKCYLNSDCLALPTVLHYPNTGVCDTKIGKCYDCVTTPDCKPYRNETCNAECSYNSLTKEYLCSNGSVCKDVPCVLDSDDVYRCSTGSSVYPLFSLVIVFLLT